MEKNYEALTVGHAIVVKGGVWSAMGYTLCSQSSSAWRVIATYTRIRQQFRTDFHE